MKTPNNIILSFLFLALLLSCRTDDFTVEKGDLTVTEVSHLSGLVLDQNNQPISNVEVTMSGVKTQTDENGVFSFRNIDISSDGSLVKIKKFGYFDGFFFTYGKADIHSYLEVVMVERKSQEFQSSTGATITANGGATISFAPNSIVTGGGRPYDGVVNISAHWYDPASEETALSMPGDLRGQDLDDEVVQLVTYGMMAVELRSPAGVELQLAPEATATLQFPLSQDVDIVQSTEIPMWHLDEETGIWIEEGSARVEGEFLVGEVSHFSFWNCDAPYPLINITGSLIAEDGTPIPYQLVMIKDNNNNISQYGITNGAGIFNGKVPADVDLSLVHYVCDEADLIMELGVLTDDVNLSPATVDTGNSTKIMASLGGCDMQPIANGYVKIASPLNTKIVTTDQDGQLDYPYFHCNETDVTLQAFDFSSPAKSELKTINTNEALQDLGNIYLCDTIPGEYIRYLVNGKSHAVPLENIEAYVVDNRILYIFANHDFDPSSIGSASVLLKYDMVTEVAQYNCFGYSAESERLETSGNGLEIEISEIGDVGSLVALTFDNGEFEGDMQVYIDKYIEPGLISGKVWLDENENGIQDPNEIPIANKRLSMLYVTIPNFMNTTSYSLYPQADITGNYVLSDSNGNFEFTGVFVEEMFRLTYFAEPGETISPKNAGSDASIDNDFYARVNSSTNGKKQYNTDDFILQSNGEITHFGLGIKQ